MTNRPPFARLNHFASDLEIPESHSISGLILVPSPDLQMANLGAYQVAAEVVGAVAGAAVEVPVDQAP
jgi:hypothetical protein